VAAVCALAVAGCGELPGAPGTIPSLSNATEAQVPDQYRAMHNPFAPGDATAVAAGRQLAKNSCSGCHAANYKGYPKSKTHPSDLTKSADTRSEQFLMWAISEGSKGDMPGYHSKLTEEQRWQLVSFIKSLK
jgi:mono/diheme cytochrome c family protein